MTTTAIESKRQQLREIRVQLEQIARTPENEAQVSGLLKRAHDVAMEILAIQDEGDE